ACLLLTEGVVADMHEIYRLLGRALHESRGEPTLRAAVLAELSIMTTAVRVERIDEALGWAGEALPHARRTSPTAARLALKAEAWARVLLGQDIDEVCERFMAASDAAVYVAQSPYRIAAQRLVWRGDVGPARALLDELRRLADEQAEPTSYALARLHFCELELRAGHVEAAEALLDEWADASAYELLLWPMDERRRARLAAVRGVPQDVERWAADAIVRAERTGCRWDELEALRAAGIAALQVRDHARAAASLLPVWQHTERQGVTEPGVFPVAPELVEA